MDRNYSPFASYWSLTTFMVWLFSMTVLLLVLPFEFVSPDLAASIDSHRQFLYLALIVEISNFIAIGVLRVYNSVRSKKYAKYVEESVNTAVERLDFAERALLREFVLQRKSVLNLPLSEPTVSSLLDSHILVQTSGEDGSGRAGICISKVARPLITYKVIGLSRTKMSEQMLDQIMSARPAFARDENEQPRAYRGMRAA